MSGREIARDMGRNLERERIDRLEEELAIAHEEIRQLRAMLFTKEGWRAPLELGLTVSEEAILAALLAGGLCTKERLLDATRRPGEETYVQLKIVDVWICKARRKMAPFDLEIVTHWGRGYELAPATRERLLNWQSEAAA